jgi:V/A-type H+/Na+-transporting ATPase subunit D
MRMGGQMLRQASVGLKQSVAIRVMARSSVGVEYPSVSAEPLPLQPVRADVDRCQFRRAKSGVVT